MKKSLTDGGWRWLNDDGTWGEPCPPPTTEELAAEENEQQRLKCQKKADETGEEVWWRGERFLPASRQGQVEDASATRKPGTKSYKVITQRDEFFKSKFNPESLEALINLHATEGWRVVSMTATDVGSFWGSFWAKGGGSSRQELVVLLEREAG